MSACIHENNWFDRTICADPCGGMHTWCSDCGKNLDYCPHDDPKLPKPMHLPEEPGRDRVIEAVRPDGSVWAAWAPYPGGNRWCNIATGDLVHFEDIVHEVQAVSRYGPHDLSLRHVPAGDES